MSATQKIIFAYRFRQVWSYDRGYYTAVFIPAPISSLWSTTALSYASGCCWRSGLIHWPIWKQI